MSDPDHRATRHALAKIARMAAAAAPSPGLAAIERTARAALGDPAAELDADLAAAAGMLDALARYAPDVDAAAEILAGLAWAQPEDAAHLAGLALALTDLAAGLRLDRA